MSTLDIDEIERRYSAASPGPWFRSTEKPSDTDFRVFALLDPPGPVAIVPLRHKAFIPPGDAEIAQARADAEFIAHAPEDIERLIAEVHRLRRLTGQ